MSSMIIVMALIGLATLFTYSYVRASPVTVYELSSELEQESSQIIDFGIYNQQDISNYLSTFTEEHFAKYFLQKTDNTEVSFIYGDETKIYITKYNTTDRGEVSLSVGDSSSNWIIDQDLITKTEIDNPSTQIKVNLLNNDYSFDLKPGENFYFIVGYEKEGEIFIEKN